MNKQIFILLILSCFTAFPQGCNDAGLCTLGYADAAHENQNPPNSIIFSEIYALGEQNTSVIISRLEVNFELFDKTTAQISTPFSVSKGSLGTTTGLGDIALSVDRQLLSTDNSMLYLTLGGKIPANDANLKMDNLPLPMVYQSSLGTYDLIVSASYFIKNWHFAFGYQHPFNANGNEFLQGQWPAKSPADNHFESAKLRRGDDLMLRAERAFSFGRNKLYIGALPIFRINEDEIDKQGIQSVPGTSGLTFNLNAAYQHALKHNSSITLMLAAPAVTRSVRTDGLTRTFLFSVSYLYPILPLPSENEIPKSIFKQGK